MNTEQFNLIVEARFPRVSPATIAACRSSIVDGMTTYAAEKKHGCTRGTTGRYVAKIYAEYAFAIEVAAHAA